MRVSINQPAYLPWAGYFDRIAASDVHIVLDHVQFEKNSFVNRNKIRTPQGWTWLTVPVTTKGRFGALPINELEMAEAERWPKKHWSALQANYAKSASFETHRGFFEAWYGGGFESPLFLPVMMRFIRYACECLGIACVNFVRAFDPQWIVFGGGVAAAGDALLTRVRAAFDRNTWRVRPEITAYTSELFYKGQLGWRAHLEDQRLDHPDAAELHGLYHVPVPHEGNAKASEEEAAAVVALYRQLLVPGVAFTNPKKDPATRDLECQDLLVVAPYNAQVDLLKERLAEAGFPDAHVGTVDKFQGQEAAVAVYSLASSSAEEAPRGMSFLYALDRLKPSAARRSRSAW